VTFSGSGEGGASPGGSRGRLLAAIAVTLVVWASGFVGIRHAGHAFPPASLALLRFLVAAATLAVLWRWSGRRAATMPPAAKPTRGEWARLALAGFLTIAVYSTALNAGSRTVTAGVACLLVNTGPIFTAIGARFFLGERIGARGWLGMLIAFGGVVVVASGMTSGFRWDGDVGLVLLAALAQAAWFGVSKPLLARHGSFATTCRTVWIGVLFLLPFVGEAWHALRVAPPAAIASVVYLGVFPGALGYMTWAYVLSRLPATRAASLLYLVPPIAFTQAWLLLGERPTALSLLGGIPIMAGVALVNARPKAGESRTA
jgi:drug/metabolite transporter (DMT)-like permease